MGSAAEEEKKSSGNGRASHEDNTAKMSEGDYVKGVEYWSAQPATNDGVLGGFGRLSQTDALTSRMFLLTVAQSLSTITGSRALSTSSPSTVKKARTRALDVGCGIGRVTASVLLPLIDEVDLVEPTPHFLNEAVRAAQAREWKPLKGDKAVRFVKKGLQEYTPGSEDGLVASAGSGTFESERSGYDVIWCQWCLGHIGDDQLVAFLSSCKKALRPGAESVIVVKENVSASWREYDEDDRSWTRSKALFREIFEKAGLKIVREDVQRGFPGELFAVWMWALR